MTSKEYIKAKLEYLIRYEPSLSFDIDMYEKILQDLESLEVLDKLVTDDCIAGNEVGLQIVNNLIERINNYRDENKQLKARLEVLEKEYKDYQNLSIQVRNAFQIGNKKITQENEKLKNAIEIIKTLPNCDICDDNWHKGCMCLQRKIKEVLSE